MSAGRPREFDEQQVLERAMELFWQRGYQGAGLAELLKHMGISRQSLYDAFGSKRELFVRTIHHYRDTQLSQALAMLEREGSPSANVVEVVHFFQGLALDRRSRGCLVANTLVELGPHDPEIADLLRRTLRLLERGFSRALARAQEAGELAEGKSPRELSRALTNSMIGMSVTGKLGLGRGAIADITAGTLSMLE